MISQIRESNQCMYVCYEPSPCLRIMMHAIHDKPACASYVCHGNSTCTVMIRRKCARIHTSCARKSSTSFLALSTWRSASPCRLVAVWSLSRVLRSSSSTASLMVSSASARVRSCVDVLVQLVTRARHSQNSISAKDHVIVTVSYYRFPFSV